MHLKRVSYDTSIKHLYRLGLEEILPAQTRLQIPTSNRSRWRHESANKYLGCELNQIASQELELLRKFAASKSAKRMFRAYSKLILTYQEIVSKIPAVSQKIQRVKKRMVELVEDIAVPKKHAFRLFDISRATFQSWKAQVLHKCVGSPLDMCLKRWPQQATKAEVFGIRDWLKKPEYQHWPIRSVALKAIRCESVMLSVGSWYKYARQLGLSRKAMKKPRNWAAHRASAPNETWHSDVTVIKTKDGIKNYLYLVVDNFSWKILSWRLSQTLRASISLETIQEAYQCADFSGETKLIVDGGPENHAHIVNDFVADSEVAIRKLTALVDVTYSNSMVEAVNACPERREGKSSNTATSSPSHPPPTTS